jgi:hypothetical protein
MATHEGVNQMTGLSRVVGGGADAWRERGAATALAAGRGLVLALVSLLAGIPLLVAAALTLGLMPIGGGVLVPPVIGAVRGLAGWQRGISARWSGVEIATPYLSRAGRGKLRWLLGDPATWRDLLWMLTNIPVGMALGLLPLTLVGYGVVGVIAIPGLALSSDPFWPFGIGFGLPALALAPFVVRR